jgi:hypothetical protein
MSVRSLLRLLLTLLLPVALLSVTYLYSYPFFHGCAFPAPGSTPRRPSNVFRQYLTHEDPPPPAPFRLLVLADPQLEGDTSLPDPADGFIPRVAEHFRALRRFETAYYDLVGILALEFRIIINRDIPDAFQAVRKRVDLVGNDFYLAHIYRSLMFWTEPTHATVLGDLIGSQWLDDEEFEKRGWRYWNRVFAGAETGHADKEPVSGGDWKNRVINIAGNHDIGYAGDISPARISRFDRVFGPANWDHRFSFPNMSNASIHLIVLNSLVLDTPALSYDVQSATYEFINDVITTRSLPVDDPSSFTLLLTHLPLHKPDGVCVDPPHFDFHSHDDSDGLFREGGLKEQNHLSQHSSRHGVLQGVFGMNPNGEARGRNGLILTGHDHEGCDVWHYLSPPNASHAGKHEAERADAESTESTEPTDPWQSVRYPPTSPLASSSPGIREVTLRSMMGEFGGNAGLLSLWWDSEAGGGGEPETVLGPDGAGEKGATVGQWRYQITMCRLGVQHWWWGVHVLGLVVVVLLVLWLGIGIYDTFGEYLVGVVHVAGNPAGDNNTPRPQEGAAAKRAPQQLEKKKTKKKH